MFALGESAQKKAPAKPADVAGICRCNKAAGKQLFRFSGIFCLQHVLAEFGGQFFQFLHCFSDPGACSIVSGIEFRNFGFGFGNFVFDGIKNFAHNKVGENVNK